MCEPAPVPVSQPTPAQQAKRLAALQFSPDPPPAKYRQADLNSHVVQTQAATKDDLNDQIAEFLYGCSLPFSIIEYPLFKFLVSSLHPGYQPPFRQAVSNKLLDKCHDKYQAVMKQLLSNKTVTMQKDGWSSVQNDPVIATSVVSDGKGYFVDAKDTGTTTRLQRPVRLCSRTRLMLRLPMGVRYGLLSQTMHGQDAQRAVGGGREPDSLWLPLSCPQPAGTRLDTAPIMKHIVEINKFFRNHHVPSAWLKGQLGSTHPQLPSGTRWKGQLICLDSYLTNRTYYIKFIQDHPDEVDRTIVQNIMDVKMFQQV